MLAVFAMLLVSFSYYIWHEVHKQEKVSFEIIERAISRSLINPIKSGDELMAQSIISNIGKEFDLDIYVFSRNKSVLASFSTNKFERQEMNEVHLGKILDGHQTIGFLSITKKSQYSFINRHAILPFLVICLFLFLLWRSFNKIKIIYSDFNGLVQKGKGQKNLIFKESIACLEALNKSVQFEIEAEIYKSRYEYRQELAHNLDQPISVLKSTMRELKQVRDYFSEYQKVKFDLISGSLDDLVDLCASLRSEYDLSESKDGPEKKTHFCTFMETRVAQTRAMVKEIPRLEINFEYSDSVGMAFVELDKTEFGNVILNLVRNSIHGITGLLSKGELDRGKIDLNLSQEGDQAILTIRDNGGGISKNVMDKIGEKGNTSKKNGNGIGIPNAIRVVEQLGGEIVFSLSENQGTEVRISLPMAQRPDYFLNAIPSLYKRDVVIIDDNEEIRETLKWRLESLKEAPRKILLFSTPEGFLESSHHLKDPFYLIDFNFLSANQNKKEMMNGLEFIKKMKVSENSALITSYFFDEDIQNKSSSLGVRMFPKSMLASLPVIDNVNYRPSDNDTPPIIHIEDKKQIRKLWKLESLKRGLEYLSFSSGSQFFNKNKWPKLNSLFAIDVSLDGEDGVQLAKELYFLGYKSLLLSTAKESIDLAKAPWVKKVMGKRFEEMLEQHIGPDCKIKA